MKKILSSLLLFILGVVVLACGFIVVCALNKDVSAFAGEQAKTIGETLKARQEDSSEEAASDEIIVAVEEVSEDAEVDALTDASDAASTLASESSLQTNAKNYSDYLNDWSNAGIDTNVVESTSVEKLSDKDELSENDSAEVSIYADKSGYVKTQRNIVELLTPDDVRDAIKDVSMGTTGKNLTFDSNYYPYYAMLNDNCKGLYKQIYASAMDLKTTFIPVNASTTNEWNNAFLSVILDHPELFWLNSGIYTEYDFNGNVIKVQLSFYDDIPDINDAKMSFEGEVDKIVTAASELKSDYDKEVYVHNYLADKLTYGAGNLDQSAYSAIVGDETVCAGYAKAFQYIMQKMEIPTYLSIGWGGSTSSGGMHGWNIIKLGNDYYNVDVTWDDQSPVIYDYFNKSDENNNMHTRMYNSIYLPVCSGSKYSKIPKS